MRIIIAFFIGIIHAGTQVEGDNIWRLKKTAKAPDNAAEEFLGAGQRKIPLLVKWYWEGSCGT